MFLISTDLFVGHLLNECIVSQSKFPKGKRLKKGGAWREELRPVSGGMTLEEAERSR